MQFGINWSAFNQSEASIYGRSFISVSNLYQCKWHYIKKLLLKKNRKEKAHNAKGHRNFKMEIWLPLTDGNLALEPAATRMNWRQCKRLIELNVGGISATTPILNWSQLKQWLYEWYLKSRPHFFLADVFNQFRFFVQSGESLSFSFYWFCQQDLSWIKDSVLVHKGNSYLIYFPNIYS